MRHSSGKFARQLAGRAAQAVTSGETRSCPPAGLSPPEGKRPHYVFRLTDRYPLVILSGLAEADFSSGWLDTLLLRFGYVQLISVLLPALAIVLYRQRRSLGKALAVNHALLDSKRCGISRSIPLTARCCSTARPARCCGVLSKTATVWTRETGMTRPTCARR